MLVIDQSEGLAEKGFQMFGEFVNTRFNASPVVYQAFMENDGEFTITAEVDGVETKRWLVPENVAYALADLFEREVQTQS